MTVRYDPELVGEVDPGGRYKPGRVSSFVFDANVALAAVVRLHKMGKWGQYMLNVIDPSGAIASGECSAGYAALQMMRYAIEKGRGNSAPSPACVIRQQEARLRKSVTKVAITRKPRVNTIEWVRNGIRAERVFSMTVSSGLSTRHNYSSSTTGKMVKRWLPSQIQALERMWWNQDTLEDISATVGHSPTACKSMADYRGLRRGDGLLSPSVVGDILGRHPNTVMNWCRLGYIQAHHSLVKSCKTGAVWEIDKEAFERFRDVWFNVSPEKRRGSSIHRMLIEGSSVSVYAAR